MKFLILTTRSILWMLVTLIATLLMFHSLLSPYWLIGSKRLSPKNVTYSPSIGVYSKCGPPTQDTNFTVPNCVLLALNGLYTNPILFPTLWKFCTVIISFGITIMMITVLTSVFSCCFQSIFRKSIFTISGSLQVFAGICFILGVMIYPINWDIDRVQQICGPESSPYYVGDCNIGSGIICAAIGIALTLISGPLAVIADKSTSTNKVQYHINEGEILICLV